MKPQATWMMKGAQASQSRLQSTHPLGTPSGTAFRNLRGGWIFYHTEAAMDMCWLICIHKGANTNNTMILVTMSLGTTRLVWIKAQEDSHSSITL